MKYTQHEQLNIIQQYLHGAVIKFYDKPLGSNMPQIYKVDDTHQFNFNKFEYVIVKPATTLLIIGDYYARSL